MYRHLHHFVILGQHQIAVQGSEQEENYHWPISHSVSFCSNCKLRNKVGQWWRCECIWNSSRKTKIGREDCVKSRTRRNTKPARQRPHKLAWRWRRRADLASDLEIAALTQCATEAPMTDTFQTRWHFHWEVEKEENGKDGSKCTSAFSVCRLRSGSATRHKTPTSKSRCPPPPPALRPSRQESALRDDRSDRTQTVLLLLLLDHPGRSYRPLKDDRSDRTQTVLLLDHPGRNHRPLKDDRSDQTQTVLLLLLLLEHPGRSHRPLRDDRSNWTQTVLLLLLLLLEHPGRSHRSLRDDRSDRTQTVLLLLLLRAALLELQRSESLPAGPLHLSLSQTFSGSLRMLHVCSTTVLLKAALSELQCSKSATSLQNP